MEREDHAALPERVYLLGLLRTYARHLGLRPGSGGGGMGWQHPDELVQPTRVFRWEAESDRAERLQVVCASHFAASLAYGLVGIAVLAATAFLLVQLVRFASPPGISVVSPSEEVLTLSAETRVAVIRGNCGSRHDHLDPERSG